MSKLKFLSSIILSLSLFCAAPSQAISVQSPEFVSDVIHRSYPLISYIIANQIFRVTAGGSGFEKFVTYISLPATRRGGQELAKAAIDTGLVKTSSQAQAASAFSTYVVLRLVDSKYFLHAPLSTAVADRIGHAFRDGVNENSEWIKGWFTENKRDSAIPAVKAVVPVVALTSIALLKTPAGGVSNMPMQLAWTASELLRESIESHLKNGVVSSETQAQLGTAAVLSGAGVFGIFLTDPTGYPNVVSEMMLRTGIMAGLETYLGANDGKLKDATQMGLQGAAAAIGVILYHQNKNGVGGEKSRIVGQAAIAFMLPLAFSAVDWAKEIVSHIYWQNK